MKMYNLEKFGILLPGLLAVILVFSLSKGIYGETKFQTETEVAAYTDKITGFNFIKGIKTSFKQEDITDDNTPFLHKQINGKKNVWVIEIKNVSLISKSGNWVTEDKYKRNFKVYIDPNDGTLFKITSKYEGYDPNLLPEPNAISAEKQLSNSGNERYLGFPKEPPKISFLDAIDAVVYGNPFLAKEIYGFYTWQSDMGKEPRRVWVIILRGLPPYEISPPPSVGFGDNKQYKVFPTPVWQRNHTRNVIDADTGKCLFSTDYPYLENPNIKKYKAK